MKRKIIVTADGSKTIQLLDWDEQYHSKHGAVQEAYHVFINAGLRLFSHQKISILEIGFGTGLNAFITLIESQKLGLEVNYIGVEAFPVKNDEIKHLNYPQILDVVSQEKTFDKMHTSTWEEKIGITDNFVLTKQKKDFFEIHDSEQYHLIYFDAFGARVQPELWSDGMFKNMYAALIEKGVLVTYSAKGSVRRAMQNVGFMVERLPGPPGKREMLRATKVLS